MKLSKFAIFLKEENLHIAYCSRTNALFEITPQLYSYFITNKKNESIDTSTFDENTLKFLAHHKIIVENNEDELYINDLKFKTLQFSFSQKNLCLTIAPTTKCNFRCNYCFEPHKDYRSMSENTITKLIEFIKNHKDAETLSLTWYGGEPLMALDAIDRILTKIQSINIPIVEHEIITNGYYFNDEAIKLFTKFPLQQIQITIDGNKQRHDIVRKNFETKSPSFDIIVSNMDKIITELPNTLLSVRVNIEKNNKEQFAEIEKYLNNRWNNHGNYNIYPGFIRRDNQNKTDFSKDVLRGKEIIDFQQSVVCKCESDYPELTPKNCSANRINAYVIGPNGEIYKCWNDVTDTTKIIGHINNDEVVNRKLLYDYMFSTAWFEDKKCLDCNVLPICFGGCPWYKVRNLISNANFNTCSLLKDETYLKRMLIDKYKAQVKSK